MTKKCVTWSDPKTWEIRSECERTIRLNQKHFANCTGMSYYDELLKYPKYHEEYKGVCSHIEMMSPDEYFEVIVETRYPFVDVHEQEHLTPKQYRAWAIEDEKKHVIPGRVEAYYQRALKGEKMPIPTIDKMQQGQEGRHRAMVAKKLGVRKIPVMIIERCD
ncbi:MAG: hypothetical protein NT038_09210 [Euryarchaeota archaeon]|nr:hypothetical protein [Euryarchaeota archaeon]